MFFKKEYMFEALIQKFEALASIDQNEMIHEVLNDKELQADIVALNQSQLYDEGVTADGKSTGDYSPVTITHYKPLAQAMGRDGETAHMTGKDSGETYDSMRVDNRGDEFDVIADDRNGVFTHPFKYGSLVGGLGLTEESKEKIIPSIRNILIENIKEKIAA